MLLTHRSAAAIRKRRGRAAPPEVWPLHTQRQPCSTRPSVLVDCLFHPPAAVHRYTSHSELSAHANPHVSVLHITPMEPTLRDAAARPMGIVMRCETKKQSSRAWNMGTSTIPQAQGVAHGISCARRHRSHLTASSTSTGYTLSSSRLIKTS